MSGEQPGQDPEDHPRNITKDYSLRLLNWQHISCGMHISRPPYLITKNIYAGGMERLQAARSN